MSSNTLNVLADSHKEFIPEIWASRGLMKLWEESLLLRVVDKSYSSEIAQKGDTVNIPVFANLVANDKIADQVYTKQTAQGKKIPVVLSYHKEVTVLVEDPLRAQASVDVIDGYMLQSARAIADAIVAVIAAQYANAGLTTGNSSTALSEDTVLAARKKLNSIYAPKSNRWFFAQDLTSLLKIPRFTESQTIGSGSPIALGEFVGKLHGFNVAEEQRLVDLTGSAGAVHNLAMNPDGILLVTRPLGLPMAGTGAVGTYMELNGIVLRVVMSYNADYGAHQITTDVLFGVKVPNEPTVGYVAPLVDVLSSAVA